MYLRSEKNFCLVQCFDAALRKGTIIGPLSPWDSSSDWAVAVKDLIEMHKMPCIYTRQQGLLYIALLRAAVDALVGCVKDLTGITDAYASRSCQAVLPIMFFSRCNVILVWHLSDGHEDALHPITCKNGTVNDANLEAGVRGNLPQNAAQREA